MSSIYPPLRLAILRDDGDGGLDLVVTTPDGKTYVDPMTAKQAARWLNQLAAHVEQKFREQVVKP